ncbi:MAG: hypothetical protein ACR2P6_08920 [Gammaproteobacteria bacterium]
MNRILSVVVSTCVLLLPGIAGAFSWDENVDGDLSGDRFNPTNLGNAANGSNLLSATSVSGDLEYFTFSLNSSQSLVGIDLSSYSSIGGPSFIAVQSGTVFTEPAAGTNVTNLLGWHHFGGADLGTDILQDIGNGAGAIGFTAPLGPGDYVFWAQETGPNSASYTLDFNVIPIPAAFWLFGSAIAALGWMRSKKA